MAAQLLAIDPTALPRVRWTFKAQHTLRVSEVLDSLGWDEAWCEVQDGDLVADAVWLGPRRVYLEVDLSTGNLADKASRYRSLDVPLLIVTYRLDYATRMFAGTPNTLVVHFDQLNHSKIGKAVTSQLCG